jgi:hypothetical protein
MVEALMQQPPCISRNTLNERQVEGALKVVGFLVSELKGL